MPPGLYRAAYFSLLSLSHYRLKRRLELHPVRARFVDDAGQVIEIDRAQRLDLVGDVAAVRGEFVFVPFVADAQAAFEQFLGLVFLRFIQEEVVAGAVGPVRVGVELAIGEGNAVL